MLTVFVVLSLLIAFVFYFADRFGATTKSIPPPPDLTLKNALIFAIMLSAMLGFMQCLVYYSISLSYVIAIPSVLLLRRLAEKYFGVSAKLALAFAFGATALWIFWQNWLVLDVIALLFALSALASANKVSLRSALVLALIIMAYDVFAVFFVQNMQTVAHAAVATPVLIRVPKYLTNGPTILGLGDIILPGMVVMVALREARERALPWLGFGTILGYFVGMFVTDIIYVAFCFPQPATLYLYPAVFGALFGIARYYGISPKELLAHRA